MRFIVKSVSTPKPTNNRNSEGLKYPHIFNIIFITLLAFLLLALLILTCWNCITRFSNFSRSSSTDALFIPPPWDGTAPRIIRLSRTRRTPKFFRKIFRRSSSDAFPPYSTAMRDNANLPFRFPTTPIPRTPPPPYREEDLRAANNVQSSPYFESSV